MQIRLGAFLSYLNVIVQNGVYLVYTPLLIHFLGNNQFGLFQLTNQAVSTLALLAVGFSSAYVKFYWEEKTKNNESVERLNGLYLLFFIFIAIVAVTMGIILMKNSQILFNQKYSQIEISIASKMILIMTRSIAINFVSSVFNSYIVANEKFIFQQSRILFSTLVQPLVVICLLIYGLDVVSVTLVQFLFAFIILCLNIRYALRKLHMKFSFGRGQVKLFICIATFSGYIFINQIADLVNDAVPGLVVGKLLNPSNVAIYAVAIQIRTVFAQLSLALSNIFIPKMNELVMRGDNEGLNFYFVKVGRIQFILLTFIFGGFVVVGQEFLKVWAGSEYVVAYWIIIMMVLPVLVPLSQSLGIEIQRARNLHKFRSWTMAVFAIANVIITILAVKYFGVIAAGSGYVFAMSVGTFLTMNIYYHFRVGLNMRIFLLNIAKLSIVPCATIVIALTLKLFLTVSSMDVLFVMGVFYSAVFMILTWQISLNKYEKVVVKEIFIRKFSEKINRNNEEA